jgi:Tol biopolymer transport system component
LTPIWSPDSLWIAFNSFLEGNTRRKRSNGVGKEEVLFSTSSGGTLSDWSGEWILQDKGVSPSVDIEVLSVEGKRESRLYLSNPSYEERRGVFSPNGRWVAYESNQSGRFEIYVRPFPDSSGDPFKISVDGGNFARWNPNRRELHYLSPSGALMTVPVNIDEPVFTHKAPAVLFPTRIGATELVDSVPPYDVSKDGRFLMRVPGDENSRPITVVLNWSPRRK